MHPPATFEFPDVNDDPFVTLVQQDPPPLRAVPIVPTPVARIPEERLVEPVVEVVAPGAHRREKRDEERLGKGYGPHRVPDPMLGTRVTRSGQKILKNAGIQLVHQTIPYYGAPEAMEQDVNIETPKRVDPKTVDSGSEVPYVERKRLEDPKEKDKVPVEEHDASDAGSIYGDDEDMVIPEPEENDNHNHWIQRVNFDLGRLFPKMPWNKSALADHCVNPARGKRSIHRDVRQVMVSSGVYRPVNQYRRDKPSLNRPILLAKKLPLISKYNYLRS